MIYLIAIKLSHIETSVTNIYANQFRPRVLNLFTVGDLESLRSFFSHSPANLEANDWNKNQKTIIEDVWLVSIPPSINQTKEASTDYVFESTALRFDSHVFSYHSDNMGKYVSVNL